MEADIIVIGAGAAGLMTAMQLSKAGKKVMVLEANDRIGGRIHTVYNISSIDHMELGAEFIHGDLPVTLATLQEAGIGYRPCGGEMWHAQDGVIKKEGFFMEDWDEFEQQLKQLNEDMSINAFLEEYFKGEQYDALKASVRQYASGYDTADPDKASTLALRKEWIEDEEGDQHRVNGGYMALLNYMANVIKQLGGNILTNSTVKDIQWQEGSVTLHTADSKEYTAAKCIITIPLGILQAGRDAQCGIRFTPEIPEHDAALQSMGMGYIIKFLFVFKEAFWLNKEITRNVQGDLAHAAFIFSEQQIPTWWTQHPDNSNILTGWLGGPPAAKLKDKSDDELIAIAKTSLAAIFNIDISTIDQLLVTAITANWSADPFALSSYSYATVATTKALSLLKQPVADTLYFAGEAYYTDTVMGTVEAALASGKQVAEIINS